MQKTSTAYQAEMKKVPNRARQYVRIRFGLIDLDAAATSTFRANNSEWFSSFEKIANDKYIVNKTYATFEKGRMKLNEKQIIASKDSPVYQGYASSEISDESGSFATPPTITIEFSKSHSTKGLSFVFDNPTKEYCKKLEIKSYLNGELVQDTIESFSDVYSITNKVFEEFNKMEIIFLQTSKPCRRARLQTIIFGIGYIFENDDIVSLTKSVDIDPISRRLPKNTAKFSIRDFEKIYNIDNPKGIWEYIEQQQPISFEFGQFLPQGLSWGDVYNESWAEMELTNWGTAYEGGYTEWVQIGDYLLSSKPNVDGYNITFECQDLIRYMTDEYYKGTYSKGGITLYDLAVNLIEFCNLVPRVDGMAHYIFSDILKEIKTIAPIPIMPVRELLQLIAHYASCILFTDINNIVHIEPISTEQDNFYLSIDDGFALPKAEKIPLLYGVKTNVYNYFTETEKTELSRQTITLDGEYSDILTFDAATDIAVTASNGVLTSNIFSSAAEISIVGFGECEIVITGNKIANSIGEYKIKAENATGETDIEDNPLITDLSVAKKQAKYVSDYLTYRTTYMLNNLRGFPELEATDLIYLQSQFTEKFPARVLKHEMTFNGAVKSIIYAKRMVKI